MRQNTFGRIINIASAHGLVASPFKAAYVAAKHGIVGLTKATAPRRWSRLRSTARLRRTAQQPNKRFATVEELDALTVFLASDAAASITGIALPVDGGWTAH